MDTLHKILDLMWKKKISDAELCSKAHINKSAVTDWKKGKTKSYMRHLTDIAEALDTTVDYLLDTKEKPSGDNAEKLSDMHREIMERLSTLSPEKLREAEAYIDYLLAQQEKDNL